MHSYMCTLTLIYIHICIYIHTYIFTHTHIYLYIHTHTHTHTRLPRSRPKLFKQHSEALEEATCRIFVEINVLAFSLTWLHVCMYIDMNVFLYIKNLWNFPANKCPYLFSDMAACVCVFCGIMYACIHIHTYTYTYI